MKFNDLQSSFLAFPAILLLMVLLQFGPADKSAVITDAGNAQITATVKMADSLTFTPDTVVIKSGQAVKWVNASVIAHSATGDPSLSTIKNSAIIPKGAKPFNSTVLDPKGTYTHTFLTPGTYKYFCIPHEAIMRGWVIVKHKN